MGKEIERKFLVESDTWLAEAVESHSIEQGYISRRPEATVRVRLRDGRGFITVKGLTSGLTRSEWEYEIPADDARRMLAEVCRGAVLRKVRYIVPAEGGLRWEIDRFEAPEGIAGLVLAEIELPAEDTPFRRPQWLGREVSGDPAYYNSNLDAQA